MDHPARFTILHTNDLHSCFEGLGPDAYFSPDPAKKDPIRGHYARLGALIRKTRMERASRGEPIFLVDAGDAEFGSLFHLLGPRSDHPAMPEYRFFHDLEYDLLGVGNHFFESGIDGLLTSWKKVEEQQLKLPFLLSNAVFSDPSGVVARRFASTIKPPGTTGFHRLMILEAPMAGKTIRIGWFGLVGPYGAKVSLANRSGLSFIGYDDLTGKEQPAALHEHAREVVRELREVHGAEMVVAVFHGGHPEDRALAKAVPGIDLILAGHTHASYAELIGNTVIAQAGYAGIQLGCLDFAWEEGKPIWLNSGNSLLPVTSAIEPDLQILSQVEEYKRAIDRLLSGTSFSYATPVFSRDTDLPRKRFPDNAAGVFVASGILTEINRRVETPVDVFFSSYGLVRSEFLCVNGGSTTFQYSDIFRFFPLGFGKDFKAGTPVHTFYLTRADLKSLLEAMAAVSMTAAVFDPVVSDSLTFSIAWWGIPFFNKVRGIQFRGQDFIADDRLIHVATDEYFSRNLRRIKVLTMGFARAVPRNRDGDELPVFPESTLPPEHDLLAYYLKSLPAPGREAHGEKQKE